MKAFIISHTCLHALGQRLKQCQFVSPITMVVLAITVQNETILPFIIILSLQNAIKTT